MLIETNFEKSHVERIILTEKCNFNCKYCYQNNKQNLSIDDEILEKRIEYLKQKIENNNFNPLYISLFGGEPLLEKNKIKKIINAFKKYPNVYFQITTNGYLLDEEYYLMFNEIKDKIQITISIDGREKGNILRTSEKNTLRIISNINYLIKNNFSLDIFTCISKNNLNYLTSDLKYFIEELKIPKISLFFVGCGINKYNAYDLSFKEKKDFLRKFFPFFEKYSDTINIYNDHLISAFYGKLNPKYYKNLNDQLNYVWIFQPNGFVYSCITNIGINIEDQYQFQITNKIKNIEQLNIHKIINYNLEKPEEYVIKELPELYKLAQSESIKKYSYELNSMYFLVDENCNLDCKYCYEKNKFNGRMSKEKALDYLAYLNDNYLCDTLVLFGGEPTLNPEVCIKVLEEAPEEIYVSMSTNGLIFNEELVKAFLKRKRTWLQISLDGKYETMRERLGNNYQLFELILKNIEKYKILKEHPEGNILNFHITLTNDNIKYLYENIKFLLNLGLTNKINITPDFKGKWSELDLFLYENQLKLIIDYIEKNYKNINKKIPYINLLSTPLPNFIEYQLDYSCGAGVSHLMINPEGDIYPCARLYTNYKERFLLGNVYDNKKIKNNLFTKINLNKANPDSCAKCKVPGCIRCYAANLEQTGDLEKCNLNQCKIIEINHKMNKIFKQRIKGEKGD